MKMKQPKARKQNKRNTNAVRKLLSRRDRQVTSLDVAENLLRRYQDIHGLASTHGVLATQYLDDDLVEQLHLLAMRGRVGLNRAVSVGLSWAKEHLARMKKGKRNG